MQITQTDFERFWEAKGRFLKINNKQRLFENLKNKIAGLRGTEALDEHVGGLRSGKESSRQLVVAFYKYLGMQPSDSPLFGKKFYDYPFERQLEIAKFLHEPKTLREIREHFSIDERTLRADLRQLEEGLSILGSTVKIESSKAGRRRYYRSTLHPIFLPLNLTEVYALTIQLGRLSRHGANAAFFQRLAERIASQLTDYAFHSLYPGKERTPAENRYLDDEASARSAEGVLMYLSKRARMRESMKLRFSYRGETYCGSLEEGNGSEPRIKLDTGAFFAGRIEECLFESDAFEYR